MTTDTNLKGQWYINDVHFRSVSGNWFGIVNTGGQGNLTDGWVGGGSSLFGGISSIERITFANDTAVASNRGSFNADHPSVGAAGNITDSWYFSSGVGRVSRVIFANDLSNANSRTSVPSTIDAGRRTATGNSTDAWVSSFNIARLAFANDTGVMLSRGGLSLSRTVSGSTGNGTDGWIVGGGSDANAGFVSRVDRIIFANDLSTASARGSISGVRGELAASGNATDGWAVGGNSGGTGPGISRVDRIIFASDTITASVRGNNSVSIDDFDGTSNLTDGWYISGGAPFISAITRIIFASDTNTAQNRGALSVSRTDHGVSS